VELTFPARMRRAFARAGFLVGLPALLSHCDASDPRAVPRISVQPSSEPPDFCATPNEGCECDTPEESAPCGLAERQVGDYVWCAEGTRVCDSEGTWGACLDTTTVRRQLSTLKPQNLGDSQSCASENPCDPFCNDFTDDSTGLMDPDGDVVVTPDGITLVQSVPPTTSGCTSLVITPDPATITLTQLSPLGPNTQQFSATLQPPSCYVGTPTVLWGLDRYDVATIDNTGLVTVLSPIAGPITVSAYIGGLSDTARLNVRVNVVETTPGVPTALATAPEAPGTADALSLLYPYANTMFPLGLLPPLVQWEATPAASAVKVTVRYPATGTPLFSWARVGPEGETLSLNPPRNDVTLPEGQRRALPPNVWSAFEQTVHRNRATSGDRGEFVIQRMTGATARNAVEHPVRFAAGQLKGTVYYQSYGTHLVENFGTSYEKQEIGASARFGAATLSIAAGASYPTVAAGYNSPSNGPGCRVCHAASAAGNVLVTNLPRSETPGEPDDTGSALFRLGVDPPNGGTRFTSPSPNAGRFSWPAIFPDGSFMLTNTGPPRDFRDSPAPGGLEGSAGDIDNQLYSLAATSQGAPIPLVGFPVGLRAATPAFSPDGTHIAFNHWAGDINGSEGDKHSLGIGHFDRTGMYFYSFARWTNNVGPCSSTSFGGIVSGEPCTDVWPSFFPDDVGAVFEREVFGNVSVPREVNGAATRRYSDFGGTRAGCSGADPSLHCGNQGTRAELWWASHEGAAESARLDAANGRNPDGSLYIPVRTHNGDGDGICEPGEDCMENNWAPGGNDDWICQPGEVCQEYNELCYERAGDGIGDDDTLCEPGETCLEDPVANGGDEDGIWEPENNETCWLRNHPCVEWDTGDGAMDGNNDGACEPGEICLEDNAAPGGDEDSRWEHHPTCPNGRCNEACVEHPNRNDNVCDPGEICAEAPASHIASDEALLNYEPTVNPTPVGGFYWTAFTSRRLYGNVATMNPWWSDPRDRPLGGQYGPPTKKIWVTAIDEDPEGGTDPSHPAFYLPGQEYLAANSKAFWVMDECTPASSTRSAATVCNSDLDCCLGGVDATCSLDVSTVASGSPVRHCIPAAVEDCIPDDSPRQCSTNEQCCGAGLGSVCASGVCRAPPPILGYGAGEFVRTFESQCDAGTHPVWQLFEWRANVPAGTQIVFEAQSAQELVDLDDAKVVEIGVATPENSDPDEFTSAEDSVDALLTEEEEGSLRYLRITMRLLPSDSRSAAPTLRDWHLVYDCFDAE
jgi:hypothetical protein